ncbi:hypothetical protein Mapa_012623 [Marchantia paleacea]|nr:hypothetical protein Mapa_012623 [Marchantia paleacea]
MYGGPGRSPEHVPTGEAGVAILLLHGQRHQHLRRDERRMPKALGRGRIRAIHTARSSSVVQELLHVPVTGQGSSGGARAVQGHIGHGGDVRSAAGSAPGHGREIQPAQPAVHAVPVHGTLLPGAGAAHGAGGARGNATSHGRTTALAGARNESSEEAGGEPRPQASAPMDSAVLHLGAVGSAQPRLAPGELVAGLFAGLSESRSFDAPLASLASSMGLAEIGAPLGALATLIDLAAFTSSVPDAEIRPASRALGAPFDLTALATAVGHAVQSTSVHALGAHSASIVHTPFASAVALAEWSASLGPLVASVNHAPLASAVRLAIQGAALGSFGAFRVVAPPSATVRNAQTRVPFCTLGAILVRASFSSAVPNAQARAAAGRLVAPFVTAPATSAMADAVIGLSLGAFRTPETLTPPASTVRFAIDGSTLRSLVATLLFASPPPAVGYAQARGSPSAFAAPPELAHFVRAVTEPRSSARGSGAAASRCANAHRKLLLADARVLLEDGNFGGRDSLMLQLVLGLVIERGRIEPNLTSHQQGRHEAPSSFRHSRRRGALVNYRYAIHGGFKPGRLTGTTASCRGETQLHTLAPRDGNTGHLGGDKSPLTGV